MPATIVQSASGSSASAPTCVVTMGSNVTSGNLLVVMEGNTGGNDNPTAVYTDTQGLTYTLAISTINVNGAQSSCGILTAPVTSSGPQVITRTIAGGNYPVSLWVIEVGGISGPSVAATSGGTSDAVSSVNTGNVVSALTDLLLVGSSGATSAAFDTFSPSGSTNATIGNNGMMAKLVGAGTYSCTFDKTSTAGGRNSCCAALISFSPASSSVQPSILVIT